jgi:hypothetical protein
MIERFLSVQDTIFICGLIFLAVKWLQRKEGWGWKRIR